MGAVINKLPWIVYAAIWAVAVGYWIVPVQPRARFTEARVIERTQPERAQIAAEPVVMAMALAAAPAVEPSRPGLTDIPVPSMPASSPELLERIRPVLNRGTNLAAASADFQDAVEFAAVAHAAQNTRVPFMVLKHRVVRERMTLADAIRASLPQADAEIEADLALAKARADIAAVSR